MADQLVVHGYHSATEPGFVRASGGGTTTFLRADGVWATVPGSGTPLTDGDKGDITVSAGGTSWTIDNGAVSTAKLGGDITTAGKALLDDADAATQRATLGLGSAATQPSSAFDAAGAAATVQTNLTTHTALTAGAHGISAFGATLVDDASATAARTTLGLGTAATANFADFEAQGNVATHAALTSSVHGISSFGASLVDDANAAAARSTLGLGTAATANTGDFDAAGEAAAVEAHLANHGLATSGVHGITAFGATLVDDANAAAARSTLGLATVASSGSGGDLTDGSLTLAKIEDVPGTTILGNGEGSAGPVTALTAAEVASMLGLPAGVSIQTVKKTADTVFASATPADVPLGASGAPALAFGVVSGRTYHFKFVAVVRSDTAAIGPGLSVTIPSATVFAAGGQFIGRAADSADGAWQGAITSSDDPVLPDAVAVVDTDYIFVIEGVLIPSATGSLTLRARTETGTTNVTVRQGTIGVLWDLGA